MDRLPDELLLPILKGLKRLDIARIRLVSRRYAYLGLQFLLTKSHFFLRRHSIARLEYIANHPVLCRTLQDITFFVDIAPSFADIEHWRGQAEGYCQGHDIHGKDEVAQEWLTRYEPFELVSMSKDGMPLSLLTAGWTYHLAMVREQADLRSTDTYRRLEKTLRKLVNLRSFTIDIFEFYHRDLMRHLYVSHRSQVWYCYNKLHSESRDEYSAAQLYATAMAASLPEISDGSLSASTLSSSSNKISVLRVNTSGYSLFQNACNEMISPTTRMERMGNSSLTTVSFLYQKLYPPNESRETSPDTPTSNESRETLEDRYTHSSVTTPEDAEGTTSSIAFLSYLTNLKHLSLAIIETKPRLRSEELFENEAWQNLSELCIWCIDIHQVSFETFLQSHATKLKVLMLGEANLRNHSSERLWSRMLRFLGTQMQLSTFGLTYALTENNEIYVDLSECWTSPAGHSVSVRLIAQYLVVGDSNMEESDKLTIAEVRQSLDFDSFEAAVYRDQM